MEVTNEKGANIFASSVGNTANDWAGSAWPGSI
jgi:hypothetical protein